MSVFTLQTRVMKRDYNNQMRANKRQENSRMIIGDNQINMIKHGDNQLKVPIKREADNQGRGQTRIIKHRISKIIKKDQKKKQRQSF